MAGLTPEFSMAGWRATHASTFNGMGNLERKIRGQSNNLNGGLIQNKNCLQKRASTTRRMLKRTIFSSSRKPRDDNDLTLADGVSKQGIDWRWETAARKPAGVCGRWCCPVGSLEICVGGKTEPAGPGPNNNFPYTKFNKTSNFCITLSGNQFVASCKKKQKKQGLVTDPLPECFHDPCLHVVGIFLELVQSH